MFGNIAIVGNDAPVYAQEARGVADAFFLGVDDRLLFAKKLANHRRKHIRKQTSANTIDWAAVLPAGAAINLRRQQAVYEEQYKGEGPLYVDLEQNCGKKGDAASRDLGAFLKHGFRAWGCLVYLWL